MGPEDCGSSGDVWYGRRKGGRVVDCGVDRVVAVSREESGVLAGEVACGDRGMDVGNEV